jgi:Tol biopolymer transport system component
MRLRWLLVLSLATSFRAAAASDIEALRDEVRGKGWIAFSARSDKGDYDLFLMRPDGSSLTNITRTPDFSEAYPLFSRDGTRILFRRVPRDETLEGNNYGVQGAAVIMRSDGSQPVVLGGDGEFPWASWSPDGKQILCMSPKGFSIVEIATKKVVRTFPRKRFFQQPTWSPDGKWIVGVANWPDTSYSIARMDLASGEVTAVNKNDDCTPDWFPDSQNIIFSWRVPGQGVNNGYGWTQLWQNTADGKHPQLIYAEDGRHIYGGHVSPDGKYVLFTGNMQEDGDPKNAGAPMNLMRLSDAPIIGGTSDALRSKLPSAKAGPVLALPAGWEPCWTFARLPER